MTVMTAYAFVFISALFLLLHFVINNIQSFFFLFFLFWGSFFFFCFALFIMIFTFIVSLLLLLWGSFIYFCQCHMLAVLYPSLLYSSSFLIVFFFAGCFLFWILSSLLLSSSLSLFLVLRIVQTAKWRSSFFNSLWFESIFNFWNLLLFADHVFFFFFYPTTFQ